MEPMLYAKGISWIDDCRIPFVDGGDSSKACKSDKDIGDASNVWLFVDGKHKRTGSNPQGRFPANLLVCDDMLNDGSITQGTKTKVLEEKNIGYEGWGLNKKKLVEKSDKGTNSRYYDIDKWFDKILNYE